VRRASEHIGGRLAYRQVRNYTLHHLEDSIAMGALKTVNNIDIHYQYADFSVDTPGYWKLHAHNNFDNGILVEVNGVPTRDYHHKQVLKFDFSKFGDAFTDSIRMTITNLLNEVFVTLFADNQPFISAVTPGQYNAPLTYSLSLDEQVNINDKCIFVIEDSQLDIGLLIAVERNISRIFQIISDYLNWNAEQIEESIRRQNTPTEEKKPTAFDVYSDDPSSEKEDKKNIFKKVGNWFKNVFQKVRDKLKRKKKGEGEEVPDSSQTEPEEPKELSPREKKKAERQEAYAKRKADREKKKAKRQAEKAKKKSKKSSELPADETTVAEPEEGSPIAEQSLEMSNPEEPENIPEEVSANE